MNLKTLQNRLLGRDLGQREACFPLIAVYQSPCILASAGLQLYGFFFLTVYFETAAPLT